MSLPYIQSGIANFLIRQKTATMMIRMIIIFAFHFRKKFLSSQPLWNLSGLKNTIAGNIFQDSLLKDEENSFDLSLSSEILKFILN